MEKYGIRVLDVMPLFVQTAMVNNMDAGSIQNMGVDLTPNDIAQQVLSLVEKKLISGHRLTPVGIKPNCFINSQQ